MCSTQLLDGQKALLRCWQDLSNSIVCVCLCVCFLFYCIAKIHKVIIRDQIRPVLSTFRDKFRQNIRRASDSKFERPYLFIYFRFWRLAKAGKTEQSISNRTTFDKITVFISVFQQQKKGRKYYSGRREKKTRWINSGGTRPK